MDVLNKPIRFLLFLSLLTVALYYSREVLVPFLLAGILSMLFLPLCRKMENRGLSRGISSILCILLFLGVLAAIGALLAWQLSDLAKDLTGIEKKLGEFAEQARRYVSQTFGITEEQQKKMMEQQQSSGGGKISGFITGFMSSLMSIMVNFVLVLVYIFLLLFFRSHLRRFVLKLVPDQDQQKSNVIMDKASGVAQQYLSGLALMIMSLWILYSIGFSIVGVKHAFFFAILCGLLEIIPFVGNLVGTSLTLLVSLAQGGDTNMIIGILLVYGTIQFIQTYILEPLVVGAEVNINPLSTILVIVIGETIWGVAGMVLAIPLLGIVKIICDHVDALKPYGFLIGEEKKSKKPGMKEKLFALFGKKK